MLVTDFDYELPQELIAQHPMEPRDHSRLLVVDKKTGEIEHKHFYDLVNYLKPGDVLVFNDTRVIPARLHGTKDTGAHVEVFLLTRRDATDWEVLVRPGKKLQVGAKINFSDELSCEVIEHTDFGGRVVRFKYDGIFEEILDRLGETPLPPYITAPLEDKERYQTVYNRERGSAAAPTAGLHFTKELLQKIKEIGCEEVFVTLHVGLGTFRPVKEDEIEQHDMHSEYCTIPQETADLINRTNEKYLESNLALIQKIPTPITPIKIDKEHRHITLAYFDQKSTVDYIGVVQGIPVCFDAKECAQDTFALQNIHRHQVAFMDRFEKQKGIAFFLIYYSHREQFYYLPYAHLRYFWDRAQEGGRKSFRLDELNPEYFLPKKNGVLVPYLDLLQKDLEDRPES